MKSTSWWAGLETRPTTLGNDLAMFEHLSIYTIVHIVVALIFPPFLLGVINRVKAVVGGRRGPPLLQAYFDLRKLFSKDSVFSETTTWVFRFGPVVSLTAALIAVMIVPLGEANAPLSFTGDLVLLAYVLGLGRFFTMVAALDTGSPFEGLGSAREATYACLAEPVMFLGLLVLARVTGTLSMSSLLGTELVAGWGAAAASLILILVSWFVVMLVENSRIPFDDPNTHLELTMIHEVMVLDHSGPAFGLILYGAAVKLFVFAALLVRLAMPVHTGYAVVDWSIFLAGTVLVAMLIGLVESVMARLRLPSIPNLLVGAGVLSLFSMILVLVKL
jgi:formate hydrogenlyase subunit 4